MKAMQLQEAKARLSQIVDAIQSEGPVVITVRGRERAVLIAKRDYDKKLARGGSLWSFLRESPLRDIDLERDRSPTRDIDL